MYCAAADPTLMPTSDLPSTVVEETSMLESIAGALPAVAVLAVTQAITMAMQELALVPVECSGQECGTAGTHVMLGHWRW
jgi:hypothetical protein